MSKRESKREYFPPMERTRLGTRVGTVVRPIELPPYACRPTFRMQQTGTEDCPHQWIIEERDDWDVSWIEWKCRQPGCTARATCEVLQ